MPDEVTPRRFPPPWTVFFLKVSNASEEEKVNRYRLAQAAKLIRLYGEKLEI